MEVWVVIASSSVLSAIVSGIFAMVNNRNKAKTGIEKGVQLLLLAELERQADKHCRNGHVSRKDLKWFLETYDSYKALGGNGYADDIKTDICKLEVENEDAR